MELVKFNPFATAPVFNTQLNRLFDDLFADAPRCNTKAAKAWSPEVDIHEADGVVTILADLPGMEKSEVTLKVEEGILTLKGERKSEGEATEKTVYRTERFTGRFERAFRLPPHADVDNIEAAFKNGVLSISIPNGTEPTGKEISIN